MHVFLCAGGWGREVFCSILCSYTLQKSGWACNLTTAVRNHLEQTHTDRTWGRFLPRYALGGCDIGPQAPVAAHSFRNDITYQNARTYPAHPGTRSCDNHNPISPGGCLWPEMCSLVPSIATVKILSLLEMLGHSKCCTSHQPDISSRMLPRKSHFTFTSECASILADCKFAASRRRNI